MRTALQGTTRGPRLCATSEVVTSTFYRRPLPDDAIPFSSTEGRRIFCEALASGGLDGYFPLAEQFHTQADPAFCGLGSLVVALNALAIDPGRLWKGPWRWFGEELLDCCVPLDVVRKRGLDLDELACLARCNGADVELRRADASSRAEWREVLARGSNADAVVIAAYDRRVLGQTGGGHFSPIAGYHRERDLALVLDVARFKYPPHWVSAEKLYDAMLPIDSTTGKARGWITLRARARGVGLGFSIRCEGDGWRALVERLATTVAELEVSADVEATVRAVVPLASGVEVRTPSADPHREAVDRARASLRALPIYTRVESIVGADRAEAVLVLLLASQALLAEGPRARIAALLGDLDESSPFAAELENVREQLSALWSHLCDAKALQSSESSSASIRSS